jgi:uncharacterized protein (TIGR03435 family)
VSGVTGADLKQRIVHIMTAGIAEGITLPRKLLIAGAAMAAIVFPLLVGVLATNAQSTGTARYDVASIRPNTSGKNDTSFGSGPAGGIRAVNITLRKLIMNAYDIRDFQIEGGPDWMGTARFDLNAKEDEPEPVHPRDMNAAQRRAYENKHRERLRNLLIERFGLTVTRTTKDLPGYILSVAKKGPKLTPSVSDETKASTSVSIGPGRGRMEGTSTSVDTMAVLLSQFLGRKVTNQTGIEGSFDFKLEWTPDGATTDTADLNSSGSIYTALQEQLGLKLESKKLPTEIIIVDKLEKPTEN